MPARWRYILQEALVGLSRNLMMTVAIILSVAVSLGLLGASLLLRDQVQLATDEWTGKIEVSIFLCDGRQCPEISTEQQASLQEALEGDPLVETVFYESKQEAYKRFQERFADQQDLLETVTPDALPASFRVKLHDPQQFDIIAGRFEAWPGVEEIVDQREVLDRVFRVIDVFKWGALFVAGIQLVAAFVLIANTIRVTAYARREQISIMKLVGASNWYIRLPFILEAVLAGVIGALIAWVTLLVAVPWLSDILARQITFTPFIGLRHAIGVAWALFLTGIGIAAISSIVSLRRFLDV